MTCYRGFDDKIAHPTYLYVHMECVVLPYGVIKDVHMFNCNCLEYLRDNVSLIKVGIFDLNLGIFDPNL